MMIVAMMKIGSINDPLNSKALVKKCEELKKDLLDDAKSLGLFKNAITLFQKSGIDLQKKQYKSEADTELLINYLQNNSK